MRDKQAHRWVFAFPSLPLASTFFVMLHHSPRATASPILSIPLSHQLLGDAPYPAKLYSVSPLSHVPGVVAKPGSYFAISLDPKTFISCLTTTGGDFGKQAPRCSADLRSSRPLPQWLYFNSATMTFEGQAPQTPAFYNITVKCWDNHDDVLDSGPSSDWFVLQVGEHSLELSSLPANIPIMAGNAVRLDPESYRVTVVWNGTLETAGNSSGVQVQLGEEIDWLRTDPLTNLTSGLVPDSLSKGSSVSPEISVVLKDRDGDTFITTQVFDVLQTHFIDALLPPFYTAPLRPFSFDIKTILRSSSISTGLSLDMSFPEDGMSPGWLTLDKTALKLFGIPPQNWTWTNVSETVGSDEEISEGTTHFQHERSLLVALTSFDQTNNFTCTKLLNIVVIDPTSFPGRIASPNGMSNGILIALIAVSCVTIAVGAVVLVFACQMSARPTKSQHHNSEDFSARSGAGSTNRATTSDQESAASTGSRPPLPPAEGMDFEDPRPSSSQDKEMPLPTFKQNARSFGSKEVTDPGHDASIKQYARQAHANQATPNFTAESKTLPLNLRKIHRSRQPSNENQEVMNESSLQRGSQVDGSHYFLGGSGSGLQERCRNPIEGILLKGPRIPRQRPDSIPRHYSSSSDGVHVGLGGRALSASDTLSVFRLDVGRSPTPSDFYSTYAGSFDSGVRVSSSSGLELAAIGQREEAGADIPVRRVDFRPPLKTVQQSGAMTKRPINYQPHRNSKFSGSFPETISDYDISVGDGMPDSDWGHSITNVPGVSNVSFASPYRLGATGTRGVFSEGGLGDSLPFKLTISAPDDEQVDADQSIQWEY